MSLVSTPSTACQSPSVCMIARSSTYAYFLETVVWQVGGVDVEEKGRQDRSLWDAFMRHHSMLSFTISGGKRKAAITNHLHDHVDHVSCSRLQVMLRCYTVS